MQYDSFGRLVFNAEPDSFRGSFATGSSGFAAWTYAYNDSGDVVGMSDARVLRRDTSSTTAGRRLSSEGLFGACSLRRSIQLHPPKA